jgi:hypothetical protein
MSVKTQLIIYYLFFLVLLGFFPIFFFLEWYLLMAIVYPLIIAYSHFMNPLRKVGYNQHKLHLSVPAIIVSLFICLAMIVTNLAGYFTYMNTHTLDKINYWLIGLIAVFMVPILVWDQIRFARMADNKQEKSEV